MKLLNKLDKAVSQIEQVCIVVMLSTMIGVTCVQILLRNFFETGLSWGDPLIRYLVLWVGFIGAALATREDRHITIDIASRWSKGRSRQFLRAISYVCSIIICSTLFVAALIFVSNEAQMGGSTFLGIPAWIPQIILPVTFGLMTLRFALRLLQEWLRPSPHSDNQAPGQLI
jgi:TRAP-type C4-dicarboxylate transport system permease small subunit